ncbi:TAXI family TRAP transporter solute-binding subunit [Inquilinus sp. OTU3971]|uniref:TAXI family TRAP transporter solute-binding subunit n=1 Tax=Inquilinus sp. OTU3971 TaxID=3043855 RepID=UPI00313D00E9
MPSSRAPLLAGLAAAFLLGLAAPGAQAQGTSATPREIIVATAPVNSPLGRWGNAFVERLKAEAGQPVSEAITAGPLPNTALLQSGRVAIGLVSLDVAAAAWGGSSPMAPGLKFDHLRALAPVAPAAVLRFVAPAGGGIVSASDLAGKRVALATDDALTEPMLKALGIAATLRRLPLTEVAKQFTDKKIDAVAVTGLEPFALPPGQPAVTFGLTVAEIARVAGAIPGVAAAAVPLPPAPPSAPAPAADPAAATDPAAVPAPAALPPQPLPPSAGMWTWLVATDALPEDVARRATEIAVGEAAPLAEAAGFEASPALDPLTNRALPFHRGAAAAWAAQGVTVPADQVR